LLAIACLIVVPLNSYEGTFSGGPLLRTLNGPVDVLIKDGSVWMINPDNSERKELCVIESNGDKSYKLVMRGDENVLGFCRFHVLGISFSNTGKEYVGYGWRRFGLGRN
jgi:hypothetical protein